MLEKSNRAVLRASRETDVVERVTGWLQRESGGWQMKVVLAGDGAPAPGSLGGVAGLGAEVWRQSTAPSAPVPVEVFPVRQAGIQQLIFPLWKINVR